MITRDETPRKWSFELTSIELLTLVNTMRYPWRTRSDYQEYQNVLAQIEKFYQANREGVWEDLKKEIEND